jgi:hypothetical protein
MRYRIKDVIRQRKKGGWTRRLLAGVFSAATVATGEMSVFILTSRYQSPCGVGVVHQAVFAWLIVVPR